MHPIGAHQGRKFRLEDPPAGLRVSGLGNRRAVGPPIAEFDRLAQREAHEGLKRVRAASRGRFEDPRLNLDRDRRVDARGEPPGDLNRLGRYRQVLSHSY